MNEERKPVTVYFDNSCPICREEIGALKSIDARGALTLIDCSAENFSDPEATRQGLTQDMLKQSMHVRDGAGQWHSAADAFVMMYDAVGFDSAVRLLKSKGARRLFDAVYPVFARHRHKLRFTGAHKVMPWLIRRAAAKQAARAATCSADMQTNSD